MNIILDISSGLLASRPSTIPSAANALPSLAWGLRNSSTVSFFIPPRTSFPLPPAAAATAQSTGQRIVIVAGLNSSLDSWGCYVWPCSAAPFGSPKSSSLASPSGNRTAAPSPCNHGLSSRRDASARRSRELKLEPHRQANGETTRVTKMPPVHI